MFNKEITITYASISNIGNRRVNEDSVGVYEGKNGKGFILCDGLGGHGMGDKASSLVKAVFLGVFAEEEDVSGLLDTSFNAAEEILDAEQKKVGAENKMKTTAVALFTDNKKAYIGHVGDSRLYVFKDNEVVRRTLDHSVPQMLVMSGEIKDEDIRNHPDRSALLRAMGTNWTEPMHEVMKPLPLRKCQAFLLCSDGFWELITEKDMCSLLKASQSVEEWLDRMNRLVQQNGENVDMDNNSAIAVWCK